MRRPRKIAIKLVLLLLLGAIINVAVAWGCAFLVDAEKLELTGDVLIPADQARRAFVTGGSWTTTKVVFTLAGNSVNEKAPYWSRATRWNPPADAADGKFLLFCLDVARGWPWHALMSMHDSWFDMNTGNEVRSLQGAIDLRGVDAKTQNPWAIVTILPLRPLWPGFAINTIFYAALLWLLFAAPGTLKRLRRRQQGRCIHCGYDMRGQPPGAESTNCPECGRPSPPLNSTEQPARLSTGKDPTESTRSRDPTR